MSGVALCEKMCCTKISLAIISEEGASHKQLNIFRKILHLASRPYSIIMLFNEEIYQLLQK